MSNIDVEFALALIVAEAAAAAVVEAAAVDVVALATDAAVVEFVHVDIIVLEAIVIPPGPPLATPPCLEDIDLKWLLELDVGGRVERFAERAIILQTADGTVVKYREGLSPIEMRTSSREVAELSSAIEISAEDIEGIGGPLSISGGWAGLIAAGWQLERQPARLLRWKPGTALEQATVVIDGVVEEVEWGAQLEPLEFSLVRAPLRQSFEAVDTQAVIDDTTWPVRALYLLDDKVIGRFYPTIFGIPGSRATVQPISLQRAVVPVYLVEDNQTGSTPVQRDSRMQICDGVIQATSVRIWDYSGDTPSHDIRPLFNAVDGHGRTVTMCDFNTPVTLTHAPGRPYYAAFAPLTGTNTLGGGVLRDDGSGLVRGMGEVIRYLLERRSDLRIDVSRMEAERAQLDAWLIDTYINEPVNVWEWIEEALFPLAPIRVVEGRNGLFIRLMRYRATQVDATRYLTVEGAKGGRLQRLSRPRTRGFESVFNRFTMDFQPDRQGGGYWARRIYDANPDASDSRVIANFRCAYSQRRFERPGKPGSGVRSTSLTSSHVWDLNTALLTLEYKALEHALPSLNYSLQGPSSLETELEVGDVTILNDREVGLVDRVALVDRLTFGGGDTRVDLIVLEDPTSTPRLLPSTP